MLTTTSPLTRRIRLIVAMIIIAALGTTTVVQVASAQPTQVSAHYAKAKKAKHSEKWYKKQFRKGAREVRKCKMSPAYKRLRGIRKWGVQQAEPKDRFLFYYNIAVASQLTHHRKLAVRYAKQGYKIRWDDGGTHITQYSILYDIVHTPEIVLASVGCYRYKG